MSDEETKLKVKLEVDILKKVCGHPGIIQLLEVFENKKYVFCVTEYASQGDLLTYMKKQEILDAKKQKYIFYQVSLALKYIHENNIIHRDIKLDNILVDEND